MGFYDEMAGVTLELIAEFGQVGTLTRVVEGDYDPVTGFGTDPVTFTQAGQLILLDYSAQEAGVSNAAGSLIQQGDKKILIAAKGLDWEPDMTTTINAGGFTWSIASIRTTNPAGTPLLYEIHGRR
ncbi:hypothetical protein [Pseudomonas putida]|uniref:hypothetical protein n=1 Tax=Pseudomonas putida TaxID=303 RepID=UPI0039DF5DA8